MQTITHTDDMQTQSKRWLIGGVALCVVAGALYAWMHGRGAQEHTAVKMTPPRAATVSPVVPPLPQFAATPPISTSIVESDESLRVQVERLIAINDPGSAYAAYFLISACTMFNSHHDLKLYDEKLHVPRAMTADEQQHMVKLCGQMTERERQARLDYLTIAVKAGLPGAAWTFASEGPFGDPSALKTRPDDPLVVAWKAQAVSQLNEAASAGDLATLIVWGMQNLSGSDLTDKHPELGYSYLLAFGFIGADGGKDPISAELYKDGSPMMDAFSQGLTKEQRAAAIAAAREIARKAKEK